MALGLAAVVLAPLTAADKDDAKFQAGLRRLIAALASPSLALGQVPTK